MTATIADEAVRRYYRQDFTARLRAVLRAGASNSAASGRDNWREPRGGGNWRERRNNDWPRRDRAAHRRAGRRPYVVASRQLASSPVHRGHRTTVPRREALILLAALNHPWLLHDHLEELASLEFRHADAERLKAALIDIAAHAPATLDPEALRAELAARDLAEVMDRIAGADHHPGGLGLGPGRRAGRCFGDLAAACRLASAMALTN